MFAPLWMARSINLLLNCTVSCVFLKALAVLLLLNYWVFYEKHSGGGAFTR